MEKPAGFWIRFLAYFIDGIIVSVPSYIILFIINTVFVAGSVAADPYMTQEEYMVTYMTLAFLPTMLITLIISVLYYGLLTASKMQGTLAKKFLALKWSMSKANGSLSDKELAVTLHTFYLESSFILVLS